MILNLTRYLLFLFKPKKYKYISESIQPFVFFFKLLALKSCDKIHKNKLILNIPDTLVFNDKDSPSMWFYTNQQGQVCRLDNVSYYTITSKFMENSFDKELVAILKKVKSVLFSLLMVMVELVEMT